LPDKAPFRGLSAAPETCVLYKNIYLRDFAKKKLINECECAFAVYARDQTTHERKRNAQARTQNSCHVALSLVGGMAFAAAGAQAEGAITILTSTGLATGKTFTGAQEGVARFVAPGSNIEIESKGMSILEGEIISGPSGKVLTKILHSECKVFHINVGGGKKKK